MGWRLIGGETGRWWCRFTGLPVLIVGGDAVMLGLAMAAAMVGKTVERLTPFPSVVERGGVGCGRGAGGLCRGVRRVKGRPREEWHKEERVVGLYQRLARGRAARLATVVAP